MKRNRKKNRIINFVDIVLVIAAFVLLYLDLNGTFDKEPVVEAVPDNCYSETLYVISDEDYSPYSFYDSEGNPSGHDVELIALVANRLHMNLDLKLMDWDDAIEEVTSGRAQVLMTTDYSDTFAGTDQLIKTIPSASDNYVVYSKTPLSTVEQLFGKRLALMENGNVNSHIDMLHLSGYGIYYANNREAMEAVSKGEADCAIMRSTVGRMLLDEVGDKSIKPMFAIGQSFMCFGVNSENAELTEEIDRVLEQLKTDGEMEKLRNKWLTTYVHRYSFKEVITYYPWIYLVAAGFAALLFASIIINNKKQKLIKMEADRYQGILENMTEGYQSVYLIDPTDDSYEVIKASEVLQQYFSEKKKFKEAFTGYIDRFVHEDDRQMLHDILVPGFIHDKLAEGDSFRIEFRDTFSGKTEWHEMSAAWANNNRVLFGFSNKTDDLLLEHMSQNVFDDFLVLYMVNLENGEMRFAKTAEGVKYEPGDFISYKKTFRNAIDEVGVPETKEFLESIADTEGLKRLISGNSRIEKIYQWDFADTGTVWLKMTIYAIEKTGNEVSAVAVGISQIDELRREVLEQQTVINAMAREFDAIYSLNVNTGAFRVLRRVMSEETAKLAEKYEKDNLFEGLDAYINNMVLPEYRARMLELNSREGYVGALRGRQEYRYRFASLYDKDHTIWQDLLLMKMCGPDEDPDYIIIGQRNVTELVLDEEEKKKQLQQALEMADAANKAKTSFLNSVSHDIRTPMNAIAGYTRMALKNIGNDESVSGYLGKIDVSGQQLLSLINQVLEMSRIESGKVVLTEEQADVVERAYAMQTMCGADVERKGLTYTLELENICHRHVLTDVSRMNQILTNIIGNAIKYTPEGGRIDCRFEELPPDREGYGLYRFTVSDTGIGMSEEYLGHLFEEFTRESSSTVNHIQGTGLGMSIVKKLVDLMGGTIDVKSKLGEGTCIAVTVPMKLAESAAESAEEDKPHRNVSFEGKRLLLVEDNEMNREIALDILEDDGFVVETAEDGDIAVEMVKEYIARGEPYHFDAILMDIQMPRMNGYEATKAIRALPDPLNTHIPIIAVSANAFEEDRVKSLSAGMDDHVSKPIDVQKLKEALTKYL